LQTRYTFRRNAMFKMKGFVAIF